ncbi:hypothetical protein EYR36_000848 [Pleurotus pulmonarius]|nr:hypothetical protein EYR36_004531 [Pleurotus pulmonarius]KAF4579039.1 hypothetical protein EYR36_000848 [Pleurotus pulmonarius]
MSKTNNNPTKLGAYKKVPCRYFDGHGVALDPPCPQGDICRFLHPEDADWGKGKGNNKGRDRKLPQKPEKYTRSNGRHDILERKGNDKTFDEYQANRRSDALVPQSDLFERYKVDTGSIVTEHHVQRGPASRCRDDNERSPRDRQGHGHRKEHRERDHTLRSFSGEERYGFKTEEIEAGSFHTQNPSLIWENESPGGSFQTNRGRKLEAKRTENEGLAVKEAMSAARGYSIPASRRSWPKIQLLHDVKASETFSKMFKDISKLASTAVMDAGQQAAEEKKLSAYTELSASVSKISSSASSMMAPALAEVFLHHTECKQRADQSSAALGAAWTKIMNEFLSEINRNVEEGLRSIVERLEVQVQDISRVRKEDSPGLKRAWDVHEASEVGRHPSLEGGWQGKTSGRNKGASDNDYDGIAPTKRRRMGRSSPTPEANDQFKDDLNPYTTTFVESLRKQMNMQDRQLQALERENKEFIRDELATTFVPDALHSYGRIEYQAGLTMTHSTSMSTLTPLQSPQVLSNQQLQVADTQPPSKSTPPITQSKDEVSAVRRSKRISKAADAVDGMTLANEETDSSGDEEDADGSFHAEHGSGEEGLDAIDSMLIPEDEPTSALASRIIRAHDNPSPPPDAGSISASGRRSRSPVEEDPVATRHSELEELTDAIAPLIIAMSRESSPVAHQAESSHTASRPLEFSPSDDPSGIENPFLSPISEVLSPQPVALDSVIHQLPSCVVSVDEQSTPRAIAPQSVPQSRTSADGRYINPASNRVSALTGTVTDNVTRGLQFVRTNGDLQLPLPMPSQHAPSTPPPKASSSKLNYNEVTPVLRRSPRRSVAPKHVATSILDPFDSTHVGTAPFPSLTRMPSPARDERSTEAVFSGDPHDLAASGLQTAKSLKGKEKASKDEDVEIPPTAKFSRALGSLSPDSSRMLSQLRFESGPSSIAQVLAEDGGSKVSLRKESFLAERLVPAPVFPHLSEGPQRVPMTPGRQTSPRRDAASKPQSIGLASSPDAMHSPARRVPISEAVSKGYISPVKAAQLSSTKGSISSGASRFEALNIPRTDSPARRVVDESKGVQRTGNAPISRPGAKVKPNIFAASQRSKSTTEAVPRLLSNPTYTPNHLPSTNLPFPLVSETVNNKSSKVIEDKDNDIVPPVSSPSKDPPSSPTKSSLKQISSKIPRPVTKPYARPVPRIIKRGDASDTQKTTASTSHLVNRPVSTLSSHSVSSVAPSPLKRKRADPKPVTRQPGPLAKDKILNSRTKEPFATTAPASPTKFRLVADVPPLPEAASPMVITPLADSSIPLPSPSEQQGLDLPVPSPRTPLLESAPPTLDKTSLVAEKATEGNSAGLQDSDTVLNGRVRRTTRTRKPVQYFPPVELISQPEPRTAPSRRKAATIPSEAEGFAGLSTVALRTLTTNNTARNQEYLTVKLETQVIRKEGSRPESPVVKIKTIAERQQELRGHQREQRALRRRAHRIGSPMDESDDSLPVITTPAEGTGSPEDCNYSENDSDTGDRPVKRTKGAEDRRVRWRRSLTKFVNLDDIQPGTRSRSQSNALGKGGLASKAKTVELDALGNLPGAKTPLHNLVQESIFVQKFVYDDDEVEPVEPQVEVIVKTTRSRAKKGKS